MHYAILIILYEVTVALVYERESLWDELSTGDVSDTNVII
jgi:hypothetical protein